MPCCLVGSLIEQKGDCMMHGEQRIDRRIGKTQEALHTALIDLMRESPYDEILVQQILDRANVGRSTFYAHFRDKDDLLTRGLDRLRPRLVTAIQEASGARASDRLVAFSLPMVEHAFEARHLYRSLLQSNSWGVIRERIAEMFRSVVRDELGSQSRKKKFDLPADIIIEFAVGTFLSLLSWWLDREVPRPPHEANALYLRLVLPTLRAELDR